MKFNLAPFSSRIFLLGLGLLGFTLVDAASAAEKPTRHLLSSAKDEALREYFDEDVEEEDSTPTKYAKAPEDGSVSSGGETVPAANPSAVAPKKKKKKKSAAVDGVGHGLQESGLPYSANVGLDVEYNRKSELLKYSDKSLKTSVASLSLQLAYLRVLGPIEVGPLLAFSTETNTSSNLTTPAINDVTKTTGLGFGLGFAFNLGNIHQSTTVPYIGLDVLKSSATTTNTTDGVAGKTAVSVSRLDLGVNFGAKIFMGGHVALKPFVSYTILVSGDSKEEITDQDTVVGSLTGNALAVGMGLATYF